MRLNIKKKDEEQYADKELTRLMKRLSRAKKINGRIKPSNEALNAYITRALTILENKAKTMGIDPQATNYITKRAEQILRMRYPEPINLEELLNELINEYHSHQKPHH